jgi:hypothetical protein
LQSDPLTNNRYAFASGNPVGNIEFDGHGYETGAHGGLWGPLGRKPSKETKRRSDAIDEGQTKAYDQGVETYRDNPGLLGTVPTSVGVHATSEASTGGYAPVPVAQPSRAARGAECTTYFVVGNPRSLGCVGGSSSLGPGDAAAAAEGGATGYTAEAWRRWRTKVGEAATPKQPEQNYKRSRLNSLERRARLKTPIPRGLKFAGGVGIVSGAVGTAAEIQESRARGDSTGETIGAASGSTIIGTGTAIALGGACSPFPGGTVVCGAFGSWAGGKVGAVLGRAVGGGVEQGIDRIGEAVSGVDDPIDDIRGFLGG